MNVFVRKLESTDSLERRVADGLASRSGAPCRFRVGCYLRAMSITVTVENDTIKLPVHVPDGTRLEITLPAESAEAAPRRTLAERYAKFVGLADDLPPDMAKNHDHYLHGASKRL